MRLVVCVVFLLVAVAAVSTWSWINGAGAGVVALRAGITLLALQAGYFVVVMVSAYIPGKSNGDEKADGTGADRRGPVPGAEAMPEPED